MILAAQLAEFEDMCYVFLFDANYSDEQKWLALREQLQEMGFPEIGTA